MATLSWNSPEGAQQRLLGDLTRIGRGPDNELSFSDGAMSGLHARIVRQGNAWVLEDNASRNGTFVNNDRVSRRTLRDGDVVTVGRMQFLFRADAPAARAAPGPTVEPGQTLMWRRGQPGPTDGRPSTVARALPLEKLLRSDTHGATVHPVSTFAVSRAAAARPDADAAQLARRLKATYEISQATAATLDTSELLDHVLAALFGLFESADRAFVLLVDPQTAEVTTAAARCRAAGPAAEGGISKTALDQAMRSREAVLCQDAAADERFAEAVSILGLGIRSLMVAPLVFRDEVLGAVHVDTVRGTRAFADADLELLCVAANQVAGALANARLHDKVVASERLAAVGQTLAGLTHCIKNILQGIKGGAFILDKGLTQNDLERVHKGWGMVRRNNAFMEELVYDLLTYSKQRTPEYSLTDLNALCADTCGFVAERARSLGVALTVQPDPALGPVEVDPRGLRRCLLNFVGNAVDACAKTAGSVTVETRSPAADGLTRIVIRDTGCGMAPETLAKLFTVFFSTKGSKGTGLGLPVSQKIIEEHGGRIDVASEVGKGTTFTLCLPPRRLDTATL
ncbi:MAG TPA: ATP-binding protein [Planctomycetota bacterium]|nr:ATP-binding protein [Planctomycetota bacterium]